MLGARPTELRSQVAEGLRAGNAQIGASDVTTTTTTTPPYRVTDPATGEVLEEFPFATDDEVERGVADAHRAFAEWRDRPIAERVAIVKRVGELFAERAEDL